MLLLRLYYKYNLPSASTMHAHVQFYLWLLSFTGNCINKCLSQLAGKWLHVSYKDYITNEEVCAKIQLAIGPCVNLLTVVKRRKQQLCCDHISCSLGLAKTIFQRKHGGQRKRWEDNIRVCAECTTRLWENWTPSQMTPPIKGHWWWW